MSKVKIKSIKVKHIYDQYPDTSYMGEYTDKEENGVIVRKYDEFLEKLSEDQEIPTRGREYRFFKPYAGGEKVGTSDYYTYGMQDYNQMEALNRGDFCFIGVGIEANIIIDHTCQTITSGGLWGISSNDTDHIKTVEQEESEELKNLLKDLNIDLSNFDQLLKEALDEEIEISY